MNRLLVYTGRQKTAPDFVKEKDLFVYPFSHCISRTEHKLDFFNFQLMSESISELLKHAFRQTSFSDCADSRAISISSEKRSRYYIMWSGGIDSTAALVAMLKNWPASEIAKLTVVLTTHSIRENPVFFESTVSKLPTLNYFASLAEIFLAPDALVITGELGDQIFGAGLLMPMAKKIGGAAFSNSYKQSGADALDEYFRADSRRRDKPGAKLLEILHPIADECPFKISNLFEFFWWFNFSQEWQFAKFKYLENKLLPPDVPYGEKIVHFFDSIDFQNWSIATPGERLPANWDDYKSHAKQYIYEFTKAPGDLELLKRQSLKNTYFLQDFRVAVTDAGAEIASYKELEDYARR